ncbi:MAG: thioredoxin domain-containing protein [Prolixibacteraceae bacterium]|jgi:thioredoxin|nr:thioredoxin domain-containing protein [Prolixibacteraceae bacterium]
MKKIKILMSVVLVISFIHMNAGNTGDISIQKLTKADFFQKIMNLEKSPNTWKYSGNLPCIVDFYADWCGPCRQASPILEELAVKYKDKIVVYKVNTDEERELASAFNIQGIQAFLWVPKNGKPTMSSGIASSKEETRAMFEKMIKEVLMK